MSYFFKVLKAEMHKQHKNYFHSKIIYVSLFLWPVLTFISAYYNFKPFELNGISIDYLNEGNLIVFVLIGYTSLSFFHSLIQSAWRFSFERISGTLELIYLSPGNRLAFIMGNAGTSLLEGVWLYVVFAAFILVAKAENLNVNGPAALVSMLIIVVLALLWGMLLNALFLFSRDSGFLFTILQDPMELFSGVKIPTTLFPQWAKIVSYVFPLTYSAEIIRRAILNGESLQQMKNLIIVSVVIGIVMAAATIIALKSGERHAKKTGNMALF